MFVDAFTNYVDCFINYDVGKEILARAQRVGFVTFMIWRNSLVGTMLQLLGRYGEITSFKSFEC